MGRKNYSDDTRPTRSPPARIQPIAADGTRADFQNLHLYGIDLYVGRQKPLSPPPKIAAYYLPFCCWAAFRQDSIGDWSVISSHCEHMILCDTLTKSWVSGAVTYKDFIAELNKTGLTVRRFAEFMGMQPNSVSNNKKSGEIPMHLAVIASLLAEMSSCGIDYTPIFERLEPSRKKPRGAARAGKFAGDPQGVLELDK